MVSAKKGLWLLLGVLLLLGCKSQSFSGNTDKKLDKLEIKPNYQVNYNLAYGGERYQFILDLISIEPWREFKYTMTGQRAFSAIISLSPQSLDTASIEVNEFGGRNDTLNHDEITVWFSRRMFNELVAYDSAIFCGSKTPFASKKTTYVNLGVEPYNYELNGVPQTIEVMKVMERRGPNWFWVLNDPNNPMIIKMDVGFEIWLKEINFN